MHGLSATKWNNRSCERTTTTQRCNGASSVWPLQDAQLRNTLEEGNLQGGGPLDQPKEETEPSHEEATNTILKSILRWKRGSCCHQNALVKYTQSYPATLASPLENAGSLTEILVVPPRTPLDGPRKFSSDVPKPESTLLSAQLPPTCWGGMLVQQFGLLSVGTINTHW